MTYRICLLGVLTLLLAAAGRADEPTALPPRGEWNCVALTPRHLALTGDYSQLQLQLFRQRMAERSKNKNKKLPKWALDYRFNISGTEAIAMYRPQVVQMLRDKPEIKLASDRGAVAVAASGYWMSPIGQSCFPDENGVSRYSLNADVAHHLFLTLDRPLAMGEKLTITLPAGERIDFTMRPEDPSPVFRINQLGYMPNAPKYAYLGAWLGTLKALPLHKEFGGKEFRLVDVDSGKTLHTGLLHPRRHDQFTPKGTPFTGEEVLEMDFSSVTAPGRCRLEVDGIGRSPDFLIGDRTMAEAFYIHARGLYHQRCGIAKEKPYTNWTLPACHQQSVRGCHPPNIDHYSKSEKHRPFGFSSTGGKSLKVSQFSLIMQNPPSVPEVLRAPGGWHDAADWDRRPQHLRIVGDLAAVYLLRPGNFCDGQLNLPESGNGIPDILDEAGWGIGHLRLKQQTNGGVGTWEETTRHPNSRDGSSAQDNLTYYLSCATRNSTLEYAAYAAELALALKKAGAEKLSEAYRDSAVRAWDFAMDKKNRCVRSFRYDHQIIFYREEPDVAPEFVVKAGFDLYTLCGDERFLAAAEQVADAAISAMHKDSWRWSPLMYAEMEVFPCYSAPLNKLRKLHRQTLTAQAQRLLKQQAENYPIRVPWYSTGEGWSHTMGWGTFHPLRRALTLIAAHALTGERKYLDGAYLANDFHNGANPFGSTLTSGLGRVYPVRFLSLDSYADGIAEFIPGITPYRNTYGIPRDAVRMAYGLYYPINPGQQFAGLNLSLLPEAELDENDCAREVSRIFPIWHRWCNVESRTVAASEFTVWETIAPAAAATGYLLNGASQPEKEWIERKPVDDIRKLPGYAPLP
jgi:endoglucanase